MWTEPDWSVTSHQRSSTESLACPCLPLIISLSGRRTNWRNRSDSSEKMKQQPSNPMQVHRQQCTLKRSLHRGLLTLTDSVSQWKRNWQEWNSFLLLGGKAELLASWSCVYLDLLSVIYEASQKNLEGEEGELEGDHEDFERQQMSHVRATTDRKLISWGSWLLPCLLPADGSVVTRAPGWQSDTWPGQVDCKLKYWGSATLRQTWIHTEN